MMLTMLKWRSELTIVAKGSRLLLNEVWASYSSSCWGSVVSY